MMILVKWYGRNEDFSPNYVDVHSGTISGKDADDCWRQFMKHEENHDLTKYTRREIVYMWEEK